MITILKCIGALVVWFLFAYLTVTCFVSFIQFDLSYFSIVKLDEAGRLVIFALGFVFSGVEIEKIIRDNL